MKVTFLGSKTQKGVKALYSFADLSTLVGADSEETYATIFG